MKTQVEMVVKKIPLAVWQAIASYSSEEIIRFIDTHKDLLKALKDHHENLPLPHGQYPCETCKLIARAEGK